MKALLFSLTFLVAQVTAAAADDLPKIGSEKLCKARSAGVRMMKSAELESVADCIRGESDARQQLGAIWDRTDSAIRRRCKAQAVALGTLSYLDLLTCIQTADDLKSPAPKSPSDPARRK